jgi:hypothetical protein
MYILKSNSKDSNRFFSEDHKSGILIQPKLHRAIYYVQNLTVDDLDFQDDTTISEVEDWIDAKKRHYEELFISTRIGIL